MNDYEELQDDIARYFSPLRDEYITDLPSIIEEISASNELSTMAKDNFLYQIHQKSVVNLERDFGTYDMLLLAVFDKTSPRYKGLLNDLGIEYFTHCLKSKKDDMADIAADYFAAGYTLDQAAEHQKEHSMDSDDSFGYPGESDIYVDQIISDHEQSKNAKFVKLLEQQATPTSAQKPKSKTNAPKEVPQKPQALSKKNTNTQQTHATKTPPQTTAKKPRVQASTNIQKLARDFNNGFVKQAAKRIQTMTTQELQAPKDIMKSAINLGNKPVIDALFNKGIGITKDHIELAKSKGVTDILPTTLLKAEKTRPKTPTPPNDFRSRIPTRGGRQL